MGLGCLAGSGQSAAMVIRLPRDCVELLTQQEGVLARWQAADCALRTSAIDALLRSDRWRVLYRGVYAAYTGKPSRESALWAAVRRCGPSAALSHVSAAELDGLCDRPGHAIHVTVASPMRIRFDAAEFGHGLPRIILHRSTRMDAARHPARTPPRTRIEETVLDLTQLARTFDGAFSWLSTACGRRLVTPDQIRAAAECRGKLRWRADVLTALDEIGAGVFSNLELRYMRNVERAHGLPEATRQARMKRGWRSAYLDNLYAAFGVAVELDGRAAHLVEDRWQDIHRDNFFAGAGIITLRYNWTDVTGRPCAVASQVAQLLRLHGWTGELIACRPSCPATLR